MYHLYVSFFSNPTSKPEARVKFPMQGADWRRKKARTVCEKRVREKGVAWRLSPLERN
jgi:hypothetical protein